MRRKILQAALDVADERGLAAVSMRSVAQRVGVSAMALYPHISNKEALLDGMVDVMLAEQLPLLERIPDGDWWDRLVVIAQGIRALAGRHPSAFSLLLSRPSITPDALKATDSVYQALVDAGVRESQVPRVERLLSTFVLGFAASEVNGRFSKGALNMRARRAQLEPAEIAAHYRLAAHLDKPIDWDREFDADLEDLRAFIEQLASGNRPPKSRRS
jgi:AcrR family transcriptional regulator